MGLKNIKWIQMSFQEIIVKVHENENEIDCLRVDLI